MAKDTDNRATSSAKRKRGNPDKTIPYRFKPGVSGNPGGRPKKQPFTEIFRNLMDSPEGQKLVLDYAKGSLKKPGSMAGMFVMREMADRVEGKVADQLEVSGEVTMTLAERIQQARNRAKETNERGGG